MQCSFQFSVLLGSVIAVIIIAIIAVITKAPYLKQGRRQNLKSPVVIMFAGLSF